MESDAGKPTSGLGRVLFPPDLLHHLDDVLDSLHSRLIDAAAERARSRSNTIEECVIGARDIAETAREFFATAASELDRTLGLREFLEGVFVHPLQFLSLFLKLICVPSLEFVNPELILKPPPPQVL